MKRKLLRVTLALVLGLVFSLVSTGPVVAADFDVYSGVSIQSAIDSASDGDVIYVHEGVYSENILINGVDVSLIAVGDVTINGATNGYYDKTIAIYNSVAAIDGFTVKSNGSSIYARGMGSYGDGEVNVTIKNNYVTDYIKNGITINGELATGMVMDNHIVSDTDSVYAQNGVQFGYGASGQVLRNIVDTNWYEGEDWTASGILIFESDDVSVKLNNISNAQSGIAIETWGWFVSSASNNKIANNNINNSDWGVSVVALSWAYSTMDSFANNNKIVNNVISSDSEDVGIEGIYIGAYSDPSDYSPVADNNKAIGNIISGFETDIVEEGTATKIHENRIGTPLE
ncbi:hypothetical protein ACFLUP_01265 [Chloroflexota bacterium]